MDRLKYFKSEFNTQGRRGENDDMGKTKNWGNFVASKMAVR